jgi:hypothetical protein
MKNSSLCKESLVLQRFFSENCQKDNLLIHLSKRVKITWKIILSLKKKKETFFSVSQKKFTVYPTDTVNMRTWEKELNVSKRFIHGINTIL